MTITGETADGWKHVGWTQRPTHFADAAPAPEGDGAGPDDREAQDDLENVHLSRGLRLDAAWANRAGHLEERFEASGLRRLKPSELHAAEAGRTTSL